MPFWPRSAEYVPGVPESTSSYCSSSPGDALAVHVAEADDLAANTPARVFAARVGNEVDPLEAQLLHLRGHLDVGLALQVHERGAFPRKLLLIVGSLAAQHLGQLRGLAGRIVHLRGVRVDGGRVHAGGKHRAVAVVDGAAPRRGVEADRACLLGHGRVLAGHDHLQIEQPAEEQKREQREEGHQHGGPVGVGGGGEGRRERRRPQERGGDPAERGDAPRERRAPSEARREAAPRPDGAGRGVFVRCATTRTL